MSLHSLVVLAAESGAEEEGGINPWLVGGLILGFLLLLMVALVAFAGGREHS
jgi:hypothetical protein